MEKIKWIIVEDFKELNLLYKFGINIPKNIKIEIEDFWLGINLQNPSEFLRIKEIQKITDEYEFLCDLVLNNDPCMKLFNKTSDECSKEYNKLWL